MKRRGYIAGLIALCLLSVMVLAARAAQAQEEEPTPGVARVSLIHGDVSTMRGDSGDWVATTINAPLVRGDKIATGSKSQTEIQLDFANVLRLGPQTEAQIADLARTQIQIQVAQGLVNYTVFKDNEADIEIDTPNMAVRPLKEGSFRIQVNSPTETQLIVRKGEAEVSTPDGSTRVEDGRIIIVRGSEHPEYQIAKAPSRDDWDKWNNERDSSIKDAKSYRYANRYYTGAQDLDRNGRWVYVPDYDWCWTPYVNLGWVPYRYGYWGWEPYWGWTWISYEPWGWAPYHYGRWFYWNNSWCWWPGYRYYGYYPTWGPAWVSFVGFGFGGRNWHFGFGFGYNSIGWLALGPYDRHYAWWGRHNSYNVVNITNITNINNYASGGRNLYGERARQGYRSNLEAALTNANVRAGISHVSTENFVRGNIPRQQTALDATTLRQGQLVQGRIPAAPTRESLRPINRPANAAATSGRAPATEKFFSRRQAPTVSRSFNEQAADVQRMMERNPLQTAERGATSAVARPATGAAPSTAGGRTGQAAGGTFGATARTSNPAAVSRAGGNIGRSAPSANAGTAQAQSARSPAEVSRPSTPAGNRASGSMPVDVRGGDQSGWRRFGQAESGTARPGAASAPVAGQDLAQRSQPASGTVNQQRQATPQENTNWRRFGTGQPRAVPNRPATVGTPQTTQPAPQSTPARAPSPSSLSRPAPQGRSESGFRSFGGQAQPAPAQRDSGTPQPTGSAQPGWSRFSGRAEGSTGTQVEGSSAPRSSSPSRSEGTQGWSRFPARAAPSESTDRSPLDLRKSITTGRSAPSSSSRNFTSSGRAAPSESPSSFGGGSRGWSAPSGAVRSAPSASPRSSGVGGGNRGWSAPSGGSAVRSAPSAPSRSYGGGGRASSAPSGGGRSAPAGHQGGQRGRR